jgi:polyhydroxyalkanoate synthesis regulator phasin
VSAGGTDEGSIREVVERLVAAATGSVALTADRAEALVDALAERGGMRREDARSVVDELTTRWRGEALRVSEAAQAWSRSTLRAAGAVSRDEVEELELRLSQLEHRLRLLEAEPRERPPLHPVSD